MSFYKYRSLATDQQFNYALDIIQNHRLYLASIDSLNDRLEGVYLIPSGFAGSGYYTYESHPLFKEALSKYRILSLSDSFNKVPMWVNYADNFNGLCIEIDENGTLKKIAKKLMYGDPTSLSNRGCNNGTFDEIAQLSLLHKSKDWEYEGEYRVLSKVQNIEYQEIDIKDIICVYIGYKVPAKIKEHIEMICKRQRIDTRIAVINVKSYAVEAVTNEEFEEIISGQDIFVYAQEK